MQKLRSRELDSTDMEETDGSVSRYCAMQGQGNSETRLWFTLACMEAMGMRLLDHFPSASILKQAKALLRYTLGTEEPASIQSMGNRSSETTPRVGTHRQFLLVSFGCVWSLQM